MAKAFTELPQFFAETAQEVAFNSIIAEEGLDELEGKNVGFVTEPIVLNTSFNLNGEAIVCSPVDAIRTFYSCGLDYLIIGSYVIAK